MDELFSPRASRPVALGEMAEALVDMIRWEKHRIELTHWLAIRGQCEPVPGAVMATWWARLTLMEESAALITSLAPHEAAVRAILNDGKSGIPDLPC